MAEIVYKLGNGGEVMIRESEYDVTIDVSFGTVDTLVIDKMELSGREFQVTLMERYT